jgi:leucyl/phenylalanyl-tRNA--protein transferase
VPVAVLFVYLQRHLIRGLMGAEGVTAPPGVRVDLLVHPTVAPAPLPPARFRFPHPGTANPEGLLAHGGDLEPSTLIAAYRAGIFPWPLDGRTLLWWSPDPRAVLSPEALRVSRRLARTLRQGRFRLTVNAAFEAVVAGCADRPETWITPALRDAYVVLHRLGWAHSVEAWTADGALAGGLYGVAVGGLFAAESMFHRVADAGTVALAALVQRVHAVGMALIDVQLSSPHLAHLGVVEMPRARYLTALARAVARPTRFGA